MICQLKQIDQLNKGHSEMTISAVGVVLRVTIYPLLEYMDFCTDISDGVAKIGEATLLGDIFCLRQFTKNPLKHVHTNSKYGHLVSIPDSDTKESFSRAARDKLWVDKKISVRKVEKSSPIVVHVPNAVIKAVYGGGART